MATLPNQETRSPYPKSQYASTTRAHVTVDLTAGKKKILCLQIIYLIPKYEKSLLKSVFNLPIEYNTYLFYSPNSLLFYCKYI